MATVVYDRASLVYPGNTTASVSELNLEVHDGEFLVLVGPSGSGKSTALRMLAGLEDVTSGEIRIEERNVAGLSPKDRDVAMVFQSYALYPNMSVRQNMGFALKNAKVPRAEIKRRVDEAAKILHLEELMDRKPKALSGGQRQRVAMGRAIVRQPSVFCMDEPLSNLDAKLRVSTRGEIAALQRRLGVTTIYVTHDQVEAMTMGHRVAVLAEGKLQQVATPAELYARPANLFVASFIGSPAMNLLSLAREGEDARLSEKLLIPAPQSGGRVVAGIRPEEWELVSSHEEDALRIEVELVEELGAESFAYGSFLNAHEGLETASPVVVRLDRRHRVGAGETLAVRPVPQDVRWFDEESGRALAG